MYISYTVHVYTMLWYSMGAATYE